MKNLDIDYKAAIILPAYYYNNNPNLKLPNSRSDLLQLINNKIIHRCPYQSHEKTNFDKFESPDKIFQKFDISPVFFNQLDIIRDKNFKIIHEEPDQNSTNFYLLKNYNEKSDQGNFLNNIRTLLYST
jgi:hypothetical protein